MGYFRLRHLFAPSLGLILACGSSAEGLDTPGPDDRPPPVEGPLTCVTLAQTVDAYVLSASFVLSSGSVASGDRVDVTLDTPFPLKVPIPVRTVPLVVGSSEVEELMLRVAFDGGTLQLDRVEEWWEGRLTLDGLLGAEVSCWHQTPEVVFAYDPSTGNCVDGAGTLGLNRWPQPMVRETRQGECADLTDIVLDEGHGGYGFLDAWDLRGADLSDSSFRFALMRGADLRGAKMADFRVAYGSLGGTVDEFTEIPINTDSSCEVVGDQLTCR